MNTRVIYVVVMLCALMGLATDIGEAQNKRVGTAGAMELTIPVGARDLAMGGSSLATTTGIEAVHWNPAGLSVLPGSAEGMFSSMQYIADITMNYGAIGANFGDIGVVGLSIRSVNFGDIPLTTNQDPEGAAGRLFSPTYVTVGLTYSRQVSELISAGFSAKLVTEQIDRVSASGVALDFGIQYRGLAGLSGLNLGVAVKNIGPQMKFDGAGLIRDAVALGGSRPAQPYKSDAASFELPSSVEIGLAYVNSISDESRYSINGSFTNDNFFFDQYRIGGEYMWSSETVNLAARTGYSLVPDADASGRIFGFTAGAGFTYKTESLNITFDYAFREVDLFANNNVFSLKLGF